MYDCSLVYKLAVLLTVGHTLSRSHRIESEADSPFEIIKFKVANNDNVQFQMSEATVEIRIRTICKLLTVSRSYLR